jgi:hypothetical protein
MAALRKRVGDDVKRKLRDGQILDRPSWNNRYHKSDRLRRRRICVRTRPTLDAGSRTTSDWTVGERCVTTDRDRTIYSD